MKKITVLGIAMIGILASKSLFAGEKRGSLAENVRKSQTIAGLVSGIIQDYKVQCGQLTVRNTGDDAFTGSLSCYGKNSFGDDFGIPLTIAGNNYSDSVDLTKVNILHYP